MKHWQQLKNLYILYISAHHLTRIIHKLGELGYIITLRGRGGGFHLSQNPKDINIGEVIEKLKIIFIRSNVLDPEKKDL